MIDIPILREVFTVFWVSSWSSNDSSSLISPLSTYSSSLEFIANQKLSTIILIRPLQALSLAECESLWTILIVNHQMFLQTIFDHHLPSFTITMFKCQHVLIVFTWGTSWRASHVRQIGICFQPPLATSHTVPPAYPRHCSSNHVCVDIWCWRRRHIVWRLFALQVLVSI